jgi:hypothetical protein
VHNKKKDKGTRRRELRKEKLHKKEEEKKLPWEERKKRLRQRKEKERLRKNIKNAVGVSAIVFFVILVIIALQTIDIEVGKPRGSGNGRGYNPEDWGSNGDVSLPEDEPDISGRSDEILGDYSFILLPRGGEEEYLIDFYENTNIFFMDMETSTVTEASKDDLQEDSRVNIWGEEKSDGSWFATDIGILTGERP